VPKSSSSDKKIKGKNKDSIKVLPTGHAEILHDEKPDIEPTEAEGLEAEVLDVPLSDEKDYTEIIQDMQDEPQSAEFEMPEESSQEYIAQDVPAAVPDYSMHEPEIEPAYEEPADNVKTEREIYEQLKDDGYVVRTKIERDVDMIMRPLEPDPFKDKENDLKEKKGIPRYIDRTEG